MGCSDVEQMQDHVYKGLEFSRRSEVAPAVCGKMGTRCDALNSDLMLRRYNRGLLDHI